MLLVIAGIAVLLLLIAPVKIRVDIHRSDGWQLDIWYRVWGLPGGACLRIGGTDHPLLLAVNEGKQVHGNVLQRALANIGAVLRANFVRRYLLRHVRVVQLDARINICLRDAAYTALLTGVMQWLAQLAWRYTGYRARIAVVPAFAAERTEVEARCIVAFRMGHMIPVLFAAVAAWLLERREHHLSVLSEEV